MIEPGGCRSRYGRLYDRVFVWLCGRAPVYPWHFQWLALAPLHQDLKSILPGITGRVLDVGCGDKPYGQWLTSAAEHVGLDVYSGPKVDVVVQPGQPWPLASESFDALLCTQVLEHVAELGHVVGEIHRVLKTGALLIVSVPFAYNEHGAPADYRRFSAHGVRLLFEGDYEIIALRRQGGIASTSIVLALNWWDATMDLSRFTRLLKALTLPLWILISGVMNAVGFVLDRLDRTDAFYGNVLLVARKISRVVER